VLRGGEHAISSPEIAAALAEVVLTWQPSWTVDLDTPEITLIGVLVQRRLLVGLALPPWEPRRTSVLPPELRPWLRHGLSRAHMRPSRAATMVRLLAPAPGDVVLDPCGGLGLLSIEAACLARVHAISLDTDAAASTAARANATEARVRGWLCEGAVVSVLHADASCSGLRAASVDAAVADLPYGMLHARMDVGALIRELARVLRHEGSALLVGSAGSTGTAMACVRSARRFPPGGWVLSEQRECAVGGVACLAVRLTRVRSLARNRAPTPTAAAASAHAFGSGGGEGGGEGVGEGVGEGGGTHGHHGASIRRPSVCPLCAECKGSFKNVRVFPKPGASGTLTRMWRCRACRGLFALDEPAAAATTRQRRDPHGVSVRIGFSEDGRSVSVALSICG
jgi:SAM-dependent methyltransferase